MLKNGSVAAGTAVGGPLGLAIGGVGSAAGQKALGGSWGDALGAAGKGASATGALQAGKGILSKALSDAPPSLPGPSAMNIGAPDAGAINSGVPNLTSVNRLPSISEITTSMTSPVQSVASGPGVLSSALDTAKGIGGGSFSDKAWDATKAVGSGIKSAGKWAAKNTDASGIILSGLGDVLDQSDERLANARADEAEYDFQQRKARDLALEPLRQALYGGLGQQIAGNYAGIAANPYTSRGGA